MPDSRLRTCVGATITSDFQTVLALWSCPSTEIVIYPRVLSALFYVKRNSPLMDWLTCCSTATRDRYALPRPAEHGHRVFGVGRTAEEQHLTGQVFHDQLLNGAAGSRILHVAVVEQSDVGALFAVPLQWGTVNLGVLDLYRKAPGSLRGTQLRDAMSAADTAALMFVGVRTDPGDGT